MKFKYLNNNITADRTIILLSLLYVIIPTILFFFGWIKLPLAIVFSVCVGWFGVKVWRALSETEVNIIKRSDYRYWVTVLFISALWLYFSGVGSLSYQNGDYIMRNPAYRDLCTYKWPVIYDLSLQPDFVKQYVGTDKVAFSYYFSFWLVPALFSKVLHLPNMARNIVLYFWALLGILLVIYNLHRIIKKKSYLIISSLIFFSGLDIIPYFVVHQKLPITDHIEWWANSYFQYSSNTSLLYWVFNQTIPCWIIISLVLMLSDNSYVAGLSALTFAYSPWATFGIIPIAIYGSYKKDNKIRKAINPFNIIVPIVLVITYGLFYSASTGSSGGWGLIFSAYSDEIRHVLACYILFIIIEAGVYFIAMGDKAKSYKYYYIVLAELMLFPLIYVIDWNFVMRGSIQPLFILMVFVIKFLLEDTDKTRKKVLTVLLVLGMVTPLCEINRSVANTISNEPYEDLIKEEVYSFGDIHTDRETPIDVVKRQHYIYDYEASLFFRTIGKTK